MITSPLLRTSTAAATLLAPVPSGDHDVPFQRATQEHG
jgi:hypothetical protein